MNEFRKMAATPALNSVVRGRARISVLEPRLIRLEWCEEGIFEDRPTQNICCRDLGEWQFSVRDEGDMLSIDTGALRVVFRDNGGCFSADNLAISFEINGQEIRWKFGDIDPCNLKGTSSELDMADGGERLDLEAWLRGERRVKRELILDDGLLSRSGWSVFDDSRTAAIMEHPVFGEWFEKRPAGAKRQDLYFFGFGHDYKAALGCAAGLFGRQPLPPHYVFGYWYSRYWAYCDREIEELTEQFARTRTPLDVLVIDTDWHLPGWTGFTWDRDFFPDPSGFLNSMKARGVHISLNLHPDRGVASHEEAYKTFRRRLGYRGKPPIPFELENPAFMDLYFKLLLNPEERRGVDCWWIDWRQNEAQAAQTGFSPLSWINRLHWLDQQRRNPRKRPLVFSCRGGMDGGRYPVGFSADTCSSWATLAMEVGFTATASNVLFGYWSHDIGGHMESQATAPELYLRWMQFGVCSPVLRSHSAKYEYAERRFWNFPAPYNELIRNEILRRHRMIPYLYGECRRGYDCGVSLCRPLYYEYPEAEEAYRNPGEYFLGDSILAVPVTVPADADTGIASHTFWLPPGEWYDIPAGVTRSGSRYVTAGRLLDELPLLVRPGAVLPEAPGEEPAGVSGIVKHLSFSIYPGKTGEYELYEDDGETIAYQTDGCVRTRIRHWKSGMERHIEIQPAEGSCPAFRRYRPVGIKLHGVIPPQSVMLNGRNIAGGWEYCGEEFCCTITIPRLDARKGAAITVKYAEDEESAPLEGWIAAARRLKKLAAIQNRTAGCTAPVKNDRLAQKIAHFGRRITLRPADWKKECRLVTELLGQLRPAFEELHAVRGHLFPFSLTEVNALLDEVYDGLNIREN